LLRYLKETVNKNDIGVSFTLSPRRMSIFKSIDSSSSVGKDRKDRKDGMLQNFWTPRKDEMSRKRFKVIENFVHG
jgi:hypothetical protein